MNADQFALNPALYGLPDRQQLKDLRIWSDHYHGFMGGVKQHEEMLFYVDRMGIEKVINLDVHAIQEEPYNEEERRILERDKSRILGIICIDPGFPDESIAKMDKWIENGPCIGIKYLIGKTGATCSHPNSDRIIRYAAELGAAIYIHSWLKVGGTPRSLYGGNVAGESTPMDVALLAKRFPNVPMICGHSGGDWELGARAIRPFDNVLFEFAGSYPHSGSVDYAVNELGADRIVWGCHGPSRSYATELSKVLDASISHADRMKIFGENYRRTWAGIFRKKGIPH
jgi:uncharacterized protein